MANVNPIGNVEKEAKKEIKKVKRDIDEFEEEAEHFLEKSVTIKVKHILFALLLIILMGGSFFLGKYGLPQSDSGNENQVQAQEVADKQSVADTVATKEKVAEPEPECTSHSDCDKEYECVNLKCEKKPEPKTTTKNTTITTKNTTTPAAGESKMLESYSKVTLEVLDVGYDWKGTWGKIETIKIKITNKESVAIGPSLIIMVVEGYEDTPKEISIPSQMATIPKGYSATRTINLPNGFSYSAKTTGDNSTKVDITFTLKDEDGTQMDTLSKIYNLT